MLIGPRAVDEGRRIIIIRSSSIVSIGIVIVVAVIIMAVIVVIISVFGVYCRNHHSRLMHDYLQV